MRVIKKKKTTSIPPRRSSEREFLIDKLLVRIRFIIEMIWWTGLAPWEVPMLRGEDDVNTSKKKQ